MPCKRAKTTRTLKGMPKARKGQKFLVVKASKKGAFHVTKVKKQR